MVNEITDELENWADIDKLLPKDNIGLLIGNGASIALWGKFRYESLYKMAKDSSKPDHLTAVEIKVFNELKTQNFELVLSSLITSGKMWGIYNKSQSDINDLKESYIKVRKSLIRAVKDVHVPFKRVSEDLKRHLRRVFSEYSYIYSSNYDLLPYWSIMNDKNLFRDFIWNQGIEEDQNLFDINNTDIWDEKITKILFLHGALHLYKNAEGRTFKKISDENTNLLEMFDVQKGSIPLFISEGTSQDKLSAIMRNDYLSFAYQQFSRHRGALVIFGHSLHPSFDQHLIDALKKRSLYEHKRNHPKKIIAISVHSGNDPHAIIDLKNRIKRDLPHSQVCFFDSQTHPLGESKWQIG